MASDFEKALRVAQDQSVATEQLSIEKEQAKQLRQHHARSIAEPYLGELGLHVVQKFLGINAPFTELTSGVAGHTLSRTSRTPDGSQFWELRGSGLFLTEEGLFVEDIRLSSREAFSILIDKIDLRSTESLYREALPGERFTSYSAAIDVHGRIYVDDQSHKVMLIIDGHEWDYRSRHIADWMANQVVQLQVALSKRSADAE